MFVDENEKDDPIDFSFLFPADIKSCPGGNPGNMMQFKSNRINKKIKG